MTLVIALFVAIAILAVVMVVSQGARAPEPEPGAHSATFDEKDARAFVAEYAAAKCREGFMSKDEIIEWVADAVEDEYPGSAAADTIEESVDRAIADLEREQQVWPSVTDCDRLTRAFNELDGAGIVAAENFSCCNNCGHGEMLGEMQQEALSRSVRGYAFYHAQDTEHAAQGHGLYVRYGTDSDDEDVNVSVGREIFEGLSEAGLAPQWNGTWSQAIFVPLKWQKRRSASL